MYRCLLYQTPEKINRILHSFVLLFYDFCVTLLPMKKFTAIALFLVCTVAVFAMEVDLASFTARSNGANITLEWESARESQVSHYEILRSTQNQNDYRYVATITAKGAASRYSFVDENAYMKGDKPETAGTLYMYKLKMVGSQKVAYSDAVSVTHNVSSVRRTWGMIKEMFR